MATTSNPSSAAPKNETANSSTPFEESYDEAMICAWAIIPTVFVAIFVIGLVGNLFVIITVATNKQMRSTTNILILNLALADLLFIIICVPFTGSTYLISEWPFGQFLCRLPQYLLHVTAHASVYTLVLMSLDRYLAVVHPIRSMTIRTTRNAVCAVVIMWIVICTCNSPMFVDFDVVEFDGDVLCLNKKFTEGDENYGKIFYGTFFLFGFFLPLMFVIVLYALMVHRLLKMGKVIKKQRDEKKEGNPTAGKTPPTSENMKARRRVTKMVIIVVTIFAVCWIPVHFMFLTQFFIISAIDSKFICIRIFTNGLAYTNSCLNPILYAFLSENFRNSFKRLCFACFTRRDHRTGGRMTFADKSNNRMSRAPRAAECFERTSVANITTAVEMHTINSSGIKKKRSKFSLLVQKGKESRMDDSKDMAENGKSVVESNVCAEEIEKLNETDRV